MRGWGGGRILYVCSAGGPEGRYGDGTDIDAPLDSVFAADGALAKLNDRSNKGDTIVVLAGHSEDVSAADMASETGSAANFSIVGLGRGTERPSFTWTAAGATWLFDTAGVELANCRLFLAGTHVTGAALTVAAPITVSADNCRIVHNEIYWGFEADKIVGDGIIVTGDSFVFAGNKAHALAAAVPSNAFMALTGADDCVIEDNDIVGATDGTTRGVVYGVTTESLRMRVRRNTMVNLLASSTIAFSPLASSTGVAIENKFVVDTGILPITAGILEWHENYCCNDAGETGALVGAASA
jgi:hypothetical protein